MNKKTKILLLQTVTPVVAVLFAVVVSSALILFIGKDPFEVYQIMLELVLAELIVLVPSYLMLHR